MNNNKKTVNILIPLNLAIKVMPVVIAIKIFQMKKILLK